MSKRLTVLSVAVLGTALPMACLYLSGVIVPYLADAGVAGGGILFLGFVLAWGIVPFVSGLVLGLVSTERPLLHGVYCTFVATLVFVVLYAIRIYTGGILDPAGSANTVLAKFVVPVVLLAMAPTMGALMGSGLRLGTKRPSVHSWSIIGSTLLNDFRNARSSTSDRTFLLFVAMLVLLLVAAYSTSKRHYYRVTIVFTNQDQHEKALDAYRFYLAVWPFDDSARENLADLYKQLGLQQDAVKEWRRAKALNPDNYFALADLYRYYLDQGRYEDALPEAEKLLALTPGSRAEELAKIYEQVAQEAEERQDFDGANSALRKVIGLGHTPYPSRDAWTRERIAFNLKRFGQMKEQVAELEKVVQLIPESDLFWLSEAWLSLGAAYVDDRRFSQAYEAFQEVDRINAKLEAMEYGTDVPPRFPPGYMFIQIARIHSLINEPGKAIASLRSAIDAGCKCQDDIAREKDFDAIRGRPEFQRLLGK